MLKRCFDIIISSLALVMLSPVIGVTAMLVLLKHGRPILFSQPRAGLNGASFRIFKFRSMRDARGPDGTPLADADRLTGFGRFIRETSLDELPGLWNVLTGDMSLVGPRPLLLEYLPLYSPDQARRHDVRPGITGWAQVNGRNALSWEEKFKLDVWYVDNKSFVLDLKICALTAIKVFTRDGISSTTHATMPPFLGGHQNSAKH